MMASFTTESWPGKPPDAPKPQPSRGNSTLPAPADPHIPPTLAMPPSAEEAMATEVQEDLAQGDSATEDYGFGDAWPLGKDPCTSLEAMRISPCLLDSVPLTSPLTSMSARIFSLSETLDLPRHQPEQEGGAPSTSGASPMSGFTQATPILEGSSWPPHMPMSMAMHQRAPSGDQDSTQPQDLDAFDPEGSISPHAPDESHGEEAGGDVTQQQQPQPKRRGRRRAEPPIVMDENGNLRQLTPMEHRRMRRRVTNRISAQRVRQKRQEELEVAEEKARVTEEENKMLQEYVTRLEASHAQLAHELASWQRRWQATAGNNLTLMQTLVDTEEPATRHPHPQPQHQSQQQYMQQAEHHQPQQPYMQSPQYMQQAEQQYLQQAEHHHLPPQQQYEGPAPQAPSPHLRLPTSPPAPYPQMGAPAPSPFARPARPAPPRPSSANLFQRPQQPPLRATQSLMHSPFAQPPPRPHHTSPRSPPVLGIPAYSSSAMGAPLKRPSTMARSMSEGLPGYHRHLDEAADAIGASELEAEQRGGGGAAHFSPLSHAASGSLLVHRAAPAPEVEGLDAAVAVLLGEVPAGIEP